MTTVSQTAAQREKEAKTASENRQCHVGEAGLSLQISTQGHRANRKINTHKDASVRSSALPKASSRHSSHQGDTRGPPNSGLSGWQEGHGVYT